MHTRQFVTYAIAGLFVAALAAGMAIQRGSAQAASLAQVTETGAATSTDDATQPVTGTVAATSTDEATAVGTATAVVSATVAATGSPTAMATTSPQASPTPSRTASVPTPVGTQVPPPAEMPARTVTVTGLGEARGAPDEAFVQVGVQTDADTASEALEQNNQQMQAVIDALVDAGVAQNDIQTQFVSLSPRYGDGTGGGTGRIVGYTAMNSVEARVSDLDQLGDLLDAAVAAGGNTIGGIRFAVSGEAEVTSQARADAMDDARTKAQQLATLAGARLGPVISVAEGAQSGPIFRGGAETDVASVPIAPGSQRLQVNLTVTWLLQ